MASKRQPTHRASLEGSDATYDLREFLDELAKQSPIKAPNAGTPVSRLLTVRRASRGLALRSHYPNFSLPCLTSPPTPGIGVILTSPHRKDDHYSSTTQTFHILPFSKKALLVDLLGAIDILRRPESRSRRPPVHYLEIDLFRPAIGIPQQETPSARAKRLFDGIIHKPEAAGPIKVDFPMQDLAPLTLFRQLTYLKIEGMMQTYQCQIWQCVWLNPHLHTLILSMSVDGEKLSSEEIRVARLFADVQPSMRQACAGYRRVFMPEKLSIVKLSLTNFIINAKPFDWFDGRKLEEIRFVRCLDAGFRLVGEHWRTTMVITTRQGKPDVYSTNLMTPRFLNCPRFDIEPRKSPLAMDDCTPSEQMRAADEEEMEA